tara:strand:- start:1118 stop:1423 length:306 start_codon:yes stop_codon:yes gene_type:complete
VQTFLIFLYVLVAISLVGLVLLQQGRGSDIGSAFGSGSSNTMFGPNSSLSPLAKITAVFSLIFLIFSFYLTFQSRVIENKISLEQEIVQPDEGILPDTLPE